MEPAPTRSVPGQPVALRAAYGPGGISPTGHGLPPTPQFFGLWPSTITQVWSAEARVDGLAERVGQLLDQRGAHLRRDAVVEQLAADQRHDGLLSLSRDSTPGSAAAAASPLRIAPSMCMWPTPAMSVHAQWIGPIGRRRSGPKRVSPPTPKVAAYAPRVHSSADQSSSMILGRVARLAARRSRRSRRERPPGGPRGSSAPPPRRSRRRGTCSSTPGSPARRRVVVELAHELVRREALAGEAVLAPERMVVDGERLDHDALGDALLEAHPPRPAARARSGSRPSGSAGPRRSPPARSRGRGPRRPPRARSTSGSPRTGASSTTRSPSRSASRSGSSCEPPTTR